MDTPKGFIHNSKDQNHFVLQRKVSCNHLGTTFIPQDSGLWKVDVKIERIDGLPLTSGKCQNATNAQDPDYGNFSAILPTPRRYVLMLPSVCMEKDVAYVVKVTYSRHESNRDGVGSILTDAVSYLE